jgi:hypothetical protein
MYAHLRVVDCVRDLHHHHQKMQPDLARSAQPNREPNPTGVRRRRNFASIRLSP